MLRATKLIDSDGRVSLTNVALYVVLAAFVYTVVKHGGVDVTALGALLTALTAYRAKAYQLDVKLAQDANREADALSRRIQELQQALDIERRYRAKTTSAALPAGLGR